MERTSFVPGEIGLETIEEKVENPKRLESIWPKRSITPNVLEIDEFKL